MEVVRSCPACAGALRVAAWPRPSLTCVRCQHVPGNERLMLEALARVGRGHREERGMARRCDRTFHLSPRVSTG